MPRASYVIALGSNRPHRRHGSPRGVIAGALEYLEEKLQLHAASAIIMTPPVGPSRRTFANAVAFIETEWTPPELLARLKQIERDFGRRTGQRWGTRTLDLDIILWSGGIWASKHLAIPHPAYRERLFVLEPLAQISPHWRDPVTGLTVLQIQARLKKPKPVDPREKPD